MVSWGTNSGRNNVMCQYKTMKKKTRWVAFKDKQIKISNNQEDKPSVTKLHSKMANISSK